MIIGIVGKSGSGKDTAAGFVPGAKRFSFADPLKKFAGEVFDWSEETLYGSSELRNVPDKRYPRGPCTACFGGPHSYAYGPSGKCSRCEGAGIEYLTPRYALQTLGTEWGRSCFADTWAVLGVRKAKEWREQVTHEYGCPRDGEWVEWACDHRCPSIAVFSDCRFVNEATAIRAAGGVVWRIVRPGVGAASSHPSETEQDSPEMERLIDWTVKNTGSLDVLKSRVLEAFAACRMTP